MMNTNVTQLEAEIERLVREHLAACERAASKAVARAFQSVDGGRTRVRRQAVSERAKTSRRTPGDVAVLAELLYSAVCANPGETMLVLAGEVGATSSDLYRSMRQLKEAGRLRSAGQRQFTRYFPMAVGPVTTA